MQSNDNNENQSNPLSFHDSNDDVTTLVDENPEYDGGINEPEELTDEEKEKIKIEKIKSQHLRYNTKKNFGTKFKKERARKNKAAKKSRKINRK